MYENKQTITMNPNGNAKYQRAERDRKEPLMTSLDMNFVDGPTLQFNEDIVRHLPRTEVKKGLAGEDLFVKDDGTANSYFIEYTDNRVAGRELRRMNGSFDHHGKHPDVQVPIAAERAFIDPREVGDKSMKVNHHCRPNTELQQVN